MTTPAVNVDKTAPTITGKVAGTPNAQRLVHRRRHRPLDLRRQPVRRRRLPGRHRRQGEGSDLSASASVTDKAGNTATATVAASRSTAPRRPPPRPASPAAGSTPRSRSACTANDNLSGVDSTYYAIDGATTATKGDTVTVGAEGVHTVSYYSVDNAGNAEAREDLSPSGSTCPRPASPPSQSPDAERQRLEQHRRHRELHLRGPDRASPASKECTSPGRSPRTARRRRSPAPRPTTRATAPAAPPP